MGTELRLNDGKGFLSGEARLFWLVFGAVLFYLE